MNYSQIRSMDISNGEEVGVSLFVTGCDFHCYNCFNSELWDETSGKLFTEGVKEKMFKLIDRPYIKRVSILGGDPLHSANYRTIGLLLKEIKEKFPDKKVWLYTGYTWEELNDIQYKGILENDANTWKKEQIVKFISNYVDVLVDGRYIHKLRDYHLKFKGSSNQRLIDIPKTVKAGEVVLYEVK